MTSWVIWSHLRPPQWAWPMLATTRLLWRLLWVFWRQMRASGALWISPACPGLYLRWGGFNTVARPDSRICFKGQLLEARKGPYPQHSGSLLILENWRCFILQQRPLSKHFYTSICTIWWTSKNSIEFDLIFFYWWLKKSLLKFTFEWQLKVHWIWQNIEGLPSFICALMIYM